MLSRYFLACPSSPARRPPPAPPTPTGAPPAAPEPECLLEIKLEINPIVEAVVVSGTKRVPDPALPKAPRRRIRVGGNVQKAKLVHHVPAPYPADAEREAIEGTVLLEAVIGKDGTLSNLDPVNSIVDERLVAAATAAVSQWRYEPARLNGQPVEVRANLSVAFQLP